MEILLRIEKKMDRILVQNWDWNLGTKRPRSPKSRDKTSPPVLAWSEPWHVGVGLDVYPV